jgi:hypothetical protein
VDEKDGVNEGSPTREDKWEGGKEGGREGGREGRHLVGKIDGGDDRHHIPEDVRE